VDLAVAAENLKLFKSVLDGAGVTFWLAWGTCLGAVREGGFIAHDYDTDVEVHERDKGRLFAVLPKLQALQFDTVFISSSNYVRVSRGGEKIDVYFLSQGRACGRPVWRSIDGCFDIDFFGRLDVVAFLGMSCNVPHRPADYLRYIYGEDWREPKPRFWDEALPGSLIPEDAHADTLHLLCEFFAKQKTPFFLMEQSCYEMVGGRLTEPGILVGAHLGDHHKIAAGVSSLKREGALVVRASFLRGSETVLSRAGELIRIKYLSKPSWAERCKGTRWLCQYGRFVDDFFSEPTMVPYLKGRCPLPRNPRTYLDFVYGEDFRNEPAALGPFGSHKIELLTRKLREQPQVEVPLTDMWMPYADPLDNLLIPYGERVVVRPLATSPRPGRIVLALLDGRLALRWVRSAREGKCWLSDFRRSEEAPSQDMAIFGEVVGIRSHRLGLRIPIGLAPLRQLFRLTGPVLRILKGRST
jgi:lipopolysaccharide cholinephosphotransferase